MRGSDCQRIDDCVSLLISDGAWTHWMPITFDDNMDMKQKEVGWGNGEEEGGGMCKRGFSL